VCRCRIPRVYPKLKSVAVSAAAAVGDFAAVVDGNAVLVVDNMATVDARVAVADSPAVAVSDQYALAEYHPVTHILTDLAARMKVLLATILSCYVSNAPVALLSSFSKVCGVQKLPEQIHIETESGVEQLLVVAPALPLQAVAAAVVVVVSKEMVAHSASVFGRVEPVGGVLQALEALLLFVSVHVAVVGEQGPLGRDLVLTFFLNSQILV
jgi:hypothetical protein